MLKKLKKKNYPMNKINFVFWGTPDVGSGTLEILKQAGYLPSLIITSLDTKSGRGLHLQSSPVAIFAEKNNIPCLKPEKLDEEFYNKLKPSCLEPNCLFIVVAYGKIIPEEILNIPHLGSINVHYSLLPKYRGASPVESAILNGDKETGISIQKMVYKMDAGPILAEEKVTIRDDETAPELRKRLIKIGGELLVEMLPKFIEGKIKAKQQNEDDATYCKKIKKEDGLIDLNGDAKRNLQNYNKFRAYAAWPRTFFFTDNKRIIITKAKLENGKFVIQKVIPEGGKEQDYFK